MGSEMCIRDRGQGSPRESSVRACSVQSVKTPSILGFCCALRLRFRRVALGVQPSISRVHDGFFFGQQPFLASLPVGWPRTACSAAVQQCAAAVYTCASAALYRSRCGQPRRGRPSAATVAVHGAAQTAATRWLQRSQLCATFVLMHQRWRHPCCCCRPFTSAASQCSCSFFAATATSAAAATATWRQRGRRRTCVGARAAGRAAALHRDRRRTRVGCASAPIPVGQQGSQLGRRASIAASHPQQQAHWLWPLRAAQRGSFRRRATWSGGVGAGRAGGRGRASGGCRPT